MSNNKYKSEILYRVPINVVKCLEEQYTKLENSYYVQIDTTKMTDDKSIMISILSIEGFRRGDYDMITTHIEDLIEDEYRRRRRNRRQKNKENKVKETIPIEEKAIAFVIGRNKSNIKRICGKFKDAGVFIECPKRGSGSVEFTISAKNAKTIDEVIMMLLESEEMALKKTKENKQKETKQTEQTKQKESESENEEEIKVIPEPNYEPISNKIEPWGDM